MKALDSLSRFLFLVLSGLATFAILASINTALNNVRRESMGMIAPVARDTGAPAQDTMVDAPPGAPDAPPRGVSASPKTGTGRFVPVDMEARAESDNSLREVARWIEALTYAVLALAGFVAAGVVVLLRIAFGPARRG